MEYFSGCNYWMDRDENNNILETATSMHECGDCVKLSYCPIKKEKECGWECTPEIRKKMKKDWKAMMDRINKLENEIKLSPDSIKIANLWKEHPPRHFAELINLEYGLNIASDRFIDFKKEHVAEVIFYIKNIIKETEARKTTSIFSSTSDSILKPTRDDVEHLKKSWYKDPIWDIYDTDGFEEYYEELKSYQEECERLWKLEETVEDLGLTGLYKLILNLQEQVDNLAEIVNEIPRYK